MLSLKLNSMIFDSLNPMYSILFGSVNPMYSTLFLSYLVNYILQGLVEKEYIYGRIF